MPASTRAKINGELQRATDKANMAASVVIGLVQALKASQEEVHLLMDKVVGAIGTTIQQLCVVWSDCRCYLQGMT